MSRNTHDRGLDHHGFDDIENLRLDAALDRYTAGTTLVQLLRDLAGRVTALEDTLGIQEFYVSAIVKSSPSGTFTISAEIDS